MKPVYRKKLSILLILLSLCAVLPNFTNARSTGKVYKIGDRGPAGGWIFYDKNKTTDGWRYLEAAPEDLNQGKNIQWNIGKNVTTGAVDTAVGTGKSNTQKIIKAQGNDKYAAKICTEYRGGGKSDWFLPSKDELNLLYINLQKNGVKDIGADYFWSSSEDDTYYARLQGFYNGKQGSSHKYRLNRVRAIRAF
ncbi:MAG: DUF1566 domain-containing protein [bacterium]|nr:DUF1566 domain-containing protein [bacterium]